MPRKSVSYKDKMVFVSDKDPTRRLTDQEAAKIVMLGTAKFVMEQIALGNIDSHGYSVEFKQ